MLHSKLSIEDIVEDTLYQLVTCEALPENLTSRLFASTSSSASVISFKLQAIFKQCLQLSSTLEHRKRRSLSLCKNLPFSSILVRLSRASIKFSQSAFYKQNLTNSSLKNSDDLMFC